MRRLVIAGASCIDKLRLFVRSNSYDTRNIILIENDSMYKQLSPEDQLQVVDTNDFDYGGEIFVPLNEYWVSKALQYQVVNISKIALMASRSKYFLSKVLRENGILCPQRYLFDEMPAKVPKRFIARPDAGYSGYGVSNFQTSGRLDKRKVKDTVLRSLSPSMMAVLSINDNKIVFERYLEGNEYSVDVFVENKKIKITRLFYKVVKWLNGKAVCDAYISVPLNKNFLQVISKWCQVLFGSASTSFGQFDFIETEGKLYPIDFSCRIGGGLDSIKSFSSSESYFSNAMNSIHPFFQPYTCQKNILSKNNGFFKGMSLSIPFVYDVYKHKQIGERLGSNISSANARIAEICFCANSFEQAIQRLHNMSNEVTLNVNKKR